MLGSHNHSLHLSFDSNLILRWFPHYMDVVDCSVFVFYNYGGAGGIFVHEERTTRYPAQRGL